MPISLTTVIDVRQWKEEVAGKLLFAVDTAMKLAQAQAQEPPPTGAPRDTGALANAIRGFATRDGDQVVGYLGTFNANVHYDVYQEFGTRHMAPKFFLGRAFQRYAPDVPRILEAMP